MLSRVRLFALIPLLLITFVSHGAEDPFAAHVRPTDPLTPEQQLKSFKLPEGFEVQLVAAEPDLRKPMNMAFDSRGRLWVTESREYPTAAPTNSRPRDTVRILRDFDTNGRARSITTFATNLNIPIGIYPFRSRSATGMVNGRPVAGRMTWKCIVWSIPNIWLLEDRNGNGKADASEVLYGPFDYSRDTHGNQASFSRGNDGWLYATHGFNNRSKVKGTDGHEIEMQSGNTYRMKIDGSRIEHWTHGQVNPFGLTFDMFGNLFSADCHSSPISQLLRGACYPSFGKPHDGIGFAPVTIRHSHGSTAIAGIVTVENPAWPTEYQGNILVGNVMTSRINRDHVEWRGATTVGHELPDFISCSDPWFRPVDLQWGPDGALYIADFYNRIIGHYEVPLTHPGRDRERGRIWRVVYKGNKAAPKTGTKQSSQQANLFQSLGSPNPVQRNLALNEICDVYGRFAVGDLRKLLGADNEYRTISALWGLHRLGALSERDILRGTINRRTLPRVHAIKIAGERKQWSTNLLSIISKSLHAENGHIRRAAAEVLMTRPDNRVLQPLLTRLEHTPAEDTHLRHLLRMGIRNQLVRDGKTLFAASAAWPDHQRKAVKEIALAVNTPAAAKFLLLTDPQTFQSDEFRTKAWQHIARHADDATAERLIDLVRDHQNQDLGDQLAMFELIRSSGNNRTESLQKAQQDWAADLVKSALASDNIDGLIWGNTPPSNRPDTQNPWSLQQRKRRDGVQATLMSSHPKGERLRGRLRSKDFALPTKLEFYLCGHNSKPGEPDTRRNKILLRDAADGRILHETYPPRSDTAIKVSWDLKKLSGRRGYVEAHDGDSRGAYAWIAFGDFEPALPELQIKDAAGVARQLALSVKLVGDFRLRQFDREVSRLLFAALPDYEIQRNAARTLATLNGGGLRWAANNMVSDLSLPDSIRRKFFKHLAPSPPPTDTEFLEAMRTATASQQTRIAVNLAGVKAGAELLLRLINDGICSPVVLRKVDVADKVNASGAKNAGQRLKELLVDAPSDSEARDERIGSHISSYRSSKTDRAKGSEIFTLACAVCHQVAGKGQIVGPQLDGIGNRGLARVIEDILDPNRNVDVAFRPETISLKNGEILTALPRDEKDGVLTVVNPAGKEVSVKSADIKARTQTTRSLMPDNFHEALTADQLNDLLAYLLSLRN